MEDVEKMIETIQISGDAYYYLLNGEEPLDPCNIEEAQDIQQMYRPAFKFISSPEPIQDTDMVEVKISVTEKKLLPGTKVVEFTVLPNLEVKVKVYDDRPYKLIIDEIRKLEPIGDAYWAEYEYLESSKTRKLLPVCKIADYEKWFSKS